MTAIDDKYAALGGAGGFLGTPQGPEQTAPDGAGRYRHYQGGSIYWTSGTGAWEVHGAIREKWASMGWELSLLGYPLTDELTTPDGIGRYNHFQHGSIYWTPSTGAWEVHGAIRGLWAELGWETSVFGYPISDEQGGQSNHRWSDFQGGTIYWEPNVGAYEVPNRPNYPAVSPSVAGAWTIPDLHTHVVGMHAALLRNNDVLLFGYKEPHEGYNGPIPVDDGDSCVLDLATLTASASPSYAGPPGVTVFPNIFCSGHSMLGDGRVFVAGGDREVSERVRWAHVFTADGGAGAWEHVADFGTGRWYPTCATLPTGEVVVVGGEDRVPNGAGPNRTFEVYSPSTGTIAPPVHQTAMDGVGQWTSYPFVLVLPNGKLFVHGGTRTTFYDLPSLTHDGTALEAAARPDRAVRTYGLEGSCVLLPLRHDSSPPHRARVMMIGGGSGFARRSPATTSCEILDTSQSPMAWELAAPLHHGRVMPDAVLLPDGTVLAMSGSAQGSADNGANPVWVAELYDPRTDTWTDVAPTSVPRLYHATALLLPDGRVMTAGTDSLWNPNPFHHAETRVEIYSPPYLFKGPRPSISDVQSYVTYNRNFTIDTPNGNQIDDVVLMRCGSSTHSFNPDQRYVSMPIVSRTASSITVTAPPNANVAPPGYYLLFVLCEGVPSVAKYVQVGRSRFLVPWPDLRRLLLDDLVAIDGRPFPFDPEDCPMCDLVVVEGGSLDDVVIEDGRLAKVLSTGTVRVIDVDGNETKATFAVAKGRGQPGFKTFTAVRKRLRGDNAVRAMLVRDGKVAGVVVSEEPVTIER